MGEGGWEAVRWGEVVVSEVGALWSIDRSIGVGLRWGGRKAVSQTDRHDGAGEEIGGVEERGMKRRVMMRRVMMMKRWRNEPDTQP